MAEKEQFKVSHNEKKSQFEVSIDGKLAVAGYEKRPGVIDFTHTMVPPELGGRGIAQQLVRTGLDYARSKNLKVVPSCPFVSTFIERHPEFQDLLSQDA